MGVRQNHHTFNHIICNKCIRIAREECPKIDEKLNNLLEKNNEKIKVEGFYKANAECEI